MSKIKSWINRIAYAFQDISEKEKVSLIEGVIAFQRDVKKFRQLFMEFNQAIQSGDEDPEAIVQKIEALVEQIKKSVR